MKNASPAALYDGIGLSVSRLGETAIVRLRGSFDVYTAGEFRHRVRDLFSRGARSFIVDLSASTHVDSSGIAAIMDMADFVKERGATMGTIAGSARTRRLFAVLGVDRVLKMLRSPRPKR